MALRELLRSLETAAKDEPSDRYGGDAYKTGLDDGWGEFARFLLEEFSEEIEEAGRGG